MAAASEKSKAAKPKASKPPPSAAEWAAQRKAKIEAAKARREEAKLGEVTQEHTFKPTPSMRAKQSLSNKGNSTLTELSLDGSSIVGEEPRHPRQNGNNSPRRQATDTAASDGQSMLSQSEEPTLLSESSFQPVPLPQASTWVPVGDDSHLRRGAPHIQSQWLASEDPPMPTIGILTAACLKVAAAASPVQQRAPVGSIMSPSSFSWRDVASSSNSAPSRFRFSVEEDYREHHEAPESPEPRRSDSKFVLTPLPASLSASNSTREPASLSATNSTREQQCEVEAVQPQVATVADSNGVPERRDKHVSDPPAAAVSAAQVPLASESTLIAVPSAVPRLSEVAPQPPARPRADVSKGADAAVTPEVAVQKVEVQTAREEVAAVPQFGSQTPALIAATAGAVTEAPLEEAAPAKLVPKVALQEPLPSRPPPLPSAPPSARAAAAVPRLAEVAPQPPARSRTDVSKDAGAASTPEVVAEQIQTAREESVPQTPVLLAPAAGTAEPTTSLQAVALQEPVSTLSLAQAPRSARKADALAQPIPATSTVPRLVEVAPKPPAWTADVAKDTVAVATTEAAVQQVQTVTANAVAQTPVLPAAAASTEVENVAPVALQEPLHSPPRAPAAPSSARKTAATAPLIPVLSAIPRLVEVAPQPSASTPDVSKDSRAAATPEATVQETQATRQEAPQTPVLRAAVAGSELETVTPVIAPQVLQEPLHSPPLAATPPSARKTDAPLQLSPVASGVPRLVEIAPQPAPSTVDASKDAVADATPKAAVQQVQVAREDAVPTSLEAAAGSEVDSVAQAIAPQVLQGPLASPLAATPPPSARKADAPAHLSPVTSPVPRLVEVAPQPPASVAERSRADVSKDAEAIATPEALAQEVQTTVEEAQTQVLAADAAASEVESVTQAIAPQSAQEPLLSPPATTQKADAPAQLITPRKDNEVLLEMEDFSGRMVAASEAQAELHREHRLRVELLEKKCQELEHQLDSARQLEVAALNTSQPPQGMGSPHSGAEGAVSPRRQPLLHRLLGSVHSTCVGNDSAVSTSSPSSSALSPQERRAGFSGASAAAEAALAAAKAAFAAVSSSSDRPRHMPKAVPSTAPLQAVSTTAGQDSRGNDASSPPPVVLPPMPPSVERARRQLSDLETVEEDEHGEGAISSPDVPRGAPSSSPSKVSVPITECSESPQHLKFVTVDADKVAAKTRAELAGLEQLRSMCEDLSKMTDSLPKEEIDRLSNLVNRLSHVVERKPPEVAPEDSERSPPISR